MDYYLYILFSQTGQRYYVGSSEDPVRRLGYHNTIEKGFTSLYRPWELVYTQQFKDKRSAMAAERKVKSWKSRVMIEKLIKGEVTL